VSDTATPALAAPAEPAPARSRAGSLRRLAELLTLTAFAFAQPILDITGRSPDFFLFRRVTPGRMRLLVAAVVLGPPLGLWAAELVARLFSRTAERALHLVFCAVLFGILAIETGKHLHLVTGAPLAVLAVVAGVALATLVARSAGFRQAVTYATPAPLVFALLFVFTSPAGALVRSTGTHGTAAAAAANRPPIVFVFLDEFPERSLLTADGKVDAKLFPNFARLAAMTTWYPNATGVSGWTPYAAPAMLTGRYPAHVVAPSYVEYPQNLFTLLGGTYDVKAYETIAELCPPTLCANVAAGRKVGFRALVKDTEKLTREIVSPYPSRSNPTEQYVEETVDAAKLAGKGATKPTLTGRFNQVAKNQPARLGPFLEGLKPTGRPSLSFLHLLLPHGPWHYLPSGTTYRNAPNSFPPKKQSDMLPGVISSEPGLAIVGTQRHLLQLAYTDKLIGAMLDRMKATGLLDKALLVVTADHGSGLTTSTKSRRLDAKNPADLCWVPLFVKLPGQKKAGVDRRNEQQVDLLPTIADVLDVRIPWDVDGISMLGPARTTTDKLWYDTPGQPQHIDVARFAGLVPHGIAPEMARTDLGVSGLYAVGPLRDWYGKKLSDVRVGAPSGVTAKTEPKVDLPHADPASGSLPAMLYGGLSGPVGSGSTWLLASVNGTVAGEIAAVHAGDGTWKFVGMVDEKYFRAGPNDVALYTVDGATLHRIAVTS
jgi:hypothetical protein